MTADPPTVPVVTIDPDLAKDLRIAGRQVDRWTAKRDALITQLVAAGGSLRDVGELAGLSHTAVRYIATGRPER